jgi:triacylglycerol lipase
MSFLLALPENLYSRTAFAAFSAAGSLNPGTARALIWLSQLAYETNAPSKIDNIGRLWSLDSIRIFTQPAKSVLPMSDTRGVIATRNGALIIAFAGTDPLVLADWVADFRFAPSAAHLHEGFQNAADAVWGEIGAAMRDAAASGRPVFLAGHSLGAALAVVAAERALREAKIARAEVYTYGLPRVGEQAFVDAYRPLDGTTYRFVHGNDLVPTVPPEQFGYRHVGRMFHCESGGRFAFGDAAAGVATERPTAGGGMLAGLLEPLRRLLSPPTSPSFRSDALGRLYGFLPQGIGDHLPDRYYHALGD